jgi:hypothetical protein
MTTVQEKKKRVRYIPLSMRVIAVAVEGEIGDWAAYIDAVEGHNHYLEFPRVAENGTKLPREVAEILFPDFKCLEWRD